MKSIIEILSAFVIVSYLSSCCTPVSSLHTTLRDTDLSTGYKLEIDNSCTSAFSSYCDEVVEKATLILKLNTGEIYNYGQNPFATSLTIQVGKKSGLISEIIETTTL